jgi:starch phosphorylase
MQVSHYTPQEIEESIQRKLRHLYDCDASDATAQQIYHALAMTVRDQVMEQRAASRGTRKRQSAKKLYYLSAEFLTGRVTYQNIINLLATAPYKEALTRMGVDLSAVVEQEPDPGLGNGGLGRLAACFLESLSSLDLPAMGCTIRYEYGLFRQKLVDGQQVELADDWLENGNDWEIASPEQTCEVKFYGWIEQDWSTGSLRILHHNPVTVLAVPYDMPVVGYDTINVNRLRMWSAQSPKKLDMASFNQGEYMAAMEEKELSEVISKVLYPEDNHYAGRELRLKQQYFFASASVQYALKDFEDTYGLDWDYLPDKVAIHINDTHPGLAIAEMMRLLMDEKSLSWDRAEHIVSGVFAYTNHTIMSEALEKWPVDMIRSMLPRVFMILEEMNRRECLKLWESFPGQWDRIGKMAIIADNQVQMANLCVWAGHAVNGVSQLHGAILKKTLFKDFYLLNPSGKYAGHKPTCIRNAHR